MLELAERLVSRSERTRDAYISYHAAVEDKRADDADAGMRGRAVTSMRKALVSDPSLKDKPGRLWGKAVRSNYRAALADMQLHGIFAGHQGRFRLRIFLAVSHCARCLSVVG